MAASDIDPERRATANRIANSFPSPSERRYAASYVSWLVGGGSGHEPTAPRNVGRQAAAEIRAAIDGVGLWREP